MWGNGTVWIRIALDVVMAGAPAFALHRAMRHHGFWPLASFWYAITLFGSLVSLQSGSVWSAVVWARILTGGP